MAEETEHDEEKAEAPAGKYFHFYLNRFRHCSYFYIEQETGAIEEPVADADIKKKKKKKGEPFDPLSDKEIKFKKVDLEHALTAEEKAARKAAKKAAAEGGKKKKKKEKAVEEEIVLEKGS